jgi:hypothetical protein
VAQVRLDGVPVASIDLYAPVTTPQPPVWSTAFDQVGPHDIELVVTGTANPASSGLTASSDGFAITF